MLWLGVWLSGLSLGLCLWVLGQPWASQVAVKASDPPPFWWPWVVSLAPYSQVLVTWRMRHRWQRQATRAGMPERWTPASWMAARLLCAGLVSTVTVLLVVGMGDTSYRVTLTTMVFGAVVGFLWPEWTLRERVAQRRQAMQHELPFVLDLMTLCVEAGLGLSAALQQVAQQAPRGLLRDSLNAAASLERTGMARSQWLARWAQDADIPGVRNLVFSLLQADRLGMSLGPVLRAQAERQRSERFQRAEKLALEAPVKMLFPMVLCIFPCTFVVIAFPIIVKFLELDA